MGAEPLHHSAAAPRSGPSEAWPRALGATTRAEIESQVTAAQERGWQLTDLRTWFRSQGVASGAATAAVKGAPVDEESFHALGRISIVGIPQWPYEPDRAAILAHLQWLVEPARGPFDDALVEIAFDRPREHSGPSAARLFPLDELEAAADFAAETNRLGSNVYVGAALRLPSSAPAKRCSGEDFYVATAVPVDIDRDYDAIRARMAAVCEDALVVTTGLTPQRRSQHWVRLYEPCEDPDEFAEAFASLVMHVGADAKV
jgi:hypothetical protein